MEKKEKVIGLITARSGSKGIPNKNMKKLNGKPLLYYASKALIGNEEIDQVILSTDSESIAEYGRELGLKVPFIRPKYLAEDNSKSIDVVKHIIKKCSLKGSICLVQPTSPLVSCSDIQKSIEIHKNTNQNVISVCETSLKLSNTCLLNEFCKISFLEKNTGTPRQLQNQYYKLNGAIFLNSIESILQTNSLVQENSIAFIMPKYRSIDIDDLYDWNVTELILKNKHIFQI